MTRIRIKKPKVRRERFVTVEILPLDPRDDLVVQAKKVLWRKRAA